MQSIAQLDDISLRTPEGKIILNHISWSLESGQRWAILGPNGAGKTTLLSILSAERHPSTGSVELLGETFGRTDLRALRMRIAKVDPSLRMLDWLHGSEAVLTGIRNTTWPHWDDWGDAEYARATALLESIGAGQFANEEIAHLSAGERQRIRLARALIKDPELLLLDEPTTGLDFPAREALLLSLDALTTSHPDLPTLTVSHHLEELPASTTHVMLLRGGEILEAGPTSEVLTSANVSACFGFPIDVFEMGGRWGARAAAGWTS
ncbi:MAG: ATP-binding cassette domain-containing protein [Thermomicrobiales bacterium]|nr:ATP-binding cassette domain-containing protein [Thermomicrobiales bacterium]